MNFVAQAGCWRVATAKIKKLVLKNHSRKQKQKQI
jgi:hypothetical protein